MSEPTALLRPDAAGFWWKHHPHAGWSIGNTAMIDWHDDTNQLAYTTGGVWARCDRINHPHDDGTRYYRTFPPEDLLRGTTEMVPPRHKPEEKP